MQYQRLFWRLTRLASVFAFSFTCAAVPGMSAVTGNGLGTVVTAGNNFTITGGTTNSGNLFHSFSAFNIANPEQATFDNGAAAAITNVIGRISGAASSIDGNISFTGTSLASANLYLINPSGIVFGNNSSLSIPGSFHASSANVINLGGDVFGAATTAMDIGSFGTAAPTSFGFLTGNTGVITAIGGADLTAGTDGTISLVGVGVNVDGAITAKSGRINLASVDVAAAGATVSNLNSGTLAISGTRGNIVLNRARLDVSGLSSAASGDANGAGGDVYIIGGDLTLNSTTITSEFFSNVSSGNINLNGSGAIALNNTDINTGHDQGLFIAGFTIPGFTIFGFTFPDIVIPDYEEIAVVKGTGGAGAGDVFITGNTVLIENGSNIFSKTEFIMDTPTGNSGSVNIRSTETRDVGLDFATFTGAPTGADIVIDGATIYSEAAGGGKSGEVTIGSSGVQTIYINSSNISTIIGNSMFEAGAVNLFSDFALVDSSMIFSNSTGAGGAGLVGWTGNSIIVQNGSVFSSSSTATAGSVPSGEVPGNPGIVQLLATVQGGYGAGSQSVLVDNSALRTTTVDGNFIGGALLSYVWLRSFGTGEIRNGSTIAASTTGAGTASYIYIQNGDWIIDGATTTVTSSQLSATGSGDAGFILLGDSRTDPTGRKLDSLVIRNGARISTDTIGTAASDAGVIDIKVVNNFDIQTGGKITSSTNDGGGGNVGLGDAGIITVHEAGSFSLTGANSEISTNTTDGAGGDINITVNGGGTGDINTGGQIISNTDGDGDAGTIALNGGDWTLNGGGLRIQSKQTSVDGLGDAGNISITADNIYFENSADITSTTDSSAALVSGDTSDAGSITLTAGLIDLNGIGVSQITSQAVAAGAVGDAGSITFNATTLNLDLADIFARNRGGSGGLIDLNVTGTATINGITYIEAGTFGAGDAGSIEVDAADFVLDDRSYLRSTSSNEGAAGSVLITTTNSTTISNGSDIRSDSTGAGAAGLVTIVADTFFLDNSQLQTNNINGAGGNISITATTQGDITNLNTGDVVNGITVATTERTLISSSTTGSGDAGSVALSGGIWNISGDTDSTVDDGFETTQSTVIRSTTSSTLANAGDAGNVSITADTAISLDAFANISSNALLNSQGDAGNILITTEDAMEAGDTATDTITISGNAIIQSNSDPGTGNAGSISIDTDIFDLSGTNTEISTNNSEGTDVGPSFGNGEIAVNANVTGQIRLGGQIKSNTDGDGDAGAISITGGQWTLSGFNNTNINPDTMMAFGDETQIESNQTTDGNYAAGGRIGDAGQIDVTVERLTLQQGGRIATSTTSDAMLNGNVSDAGNVNITANDNVDGTADFITSSAFTFDFFGFTFTFPSAISGINANSNSGIGNAGSISIDTGTAQISNTLIQTATNDGAGGNISITADSFTADGATISAETVGAGQAGQIDFIGATGSNFDITGTTVTTAAATTSTSNAGNIAFNVDTLLIDGNSNISSNSVATGISAGLAGKISINATTFTLDGAKIETNTVDGNTGGTGTSAGLINVDVGTGVIRNNDASAAATIISSSTSGTGNAGSVSLNAATWSITGDAVANMDGSEGTASTVIRSTTSSTLATAGDAGNVAIVADTAIAIGTFANISSNALAASQGDAGNILISTEDAMEVGDVATDTITISGNAIIQSNSDSGTGNAGSIRINTDIFDLSGTNTEISTNNSDGTDVGPDFDNGQISINANVTGNVRTGGQIASNTIGDGDAGAVSITGGNWTLTGFNNAGTDEVQIESSQTTDGTYAAGGRVGDAGQIDVVVNKLTLEQGGRISSSTTSDATLIGNVSDAGDINITANDNVAGTNDLIISSGITFDFFGFTFTFPTAISGISANSNQGIGDAGKISINTGSALLSDALIQTRTNAGVGGDIRITANDKFDGNSGLAITSDTIGAGKAGRIDLIGGAGSNWELSGVSVNTSADSMASGGAGGIRFDVDTLLLDAGTQIASDSTATAAGAGGVAGTAGRIRVAANTFTLDGATIATNTVDGNINSVDPIAGLIEVTVGTGVIKNTGTNVTEISSSTTGAGNAGSVSIDATTWSITGDGVARGDTVIRSNTNSSGNAGTVSVTADNSILIDDFAVISSSAGNGSTGNAGQVVLSTEVSGAETNDTIMVLGESLISSSASTGTATGAAGAVDITTDLFTIDGATISTETNSGTDLSGGGQIGTITITANDTGTVQNSSVAAPTSISANTVGSGLAGNISLEGLNWNISGNAADTTMSRSTVISSNTLAGSGNAGRVGTTINGALSVSQFAQIATNTLGTSTGRAGDIALTAGNSVTIETDAEVASNSITSGAAGSVTITTDPSDSITTDFVVINSGGEVSSGSSIDGVGVGIGDAGDVIITTDLLMTNDGEITTETENGAGGNVLITAKVANIANGTDITADSDGSGSAGNVTIVSATSLNINSGSTVSSNSNDPLATGSAGSVSLTTADLDVDNATVATVNRDGATPALITIDATSGIATATFSNNAQITASTVGAGPAGDIMITAGDALVQTGSVISSSSEMGTGSAGSVSIEAGDITIDNASVRTVNNAGADLANIVLRATNPTTGIITNGAVVTASTVGAGDAGSISLLGPNWIVSGATTQVTSSTSGAGDAGQITATTGNFLLDAATISTNSTSAGDSGAILIDSGLITLTNGGTIQSNVSGTGDGGVVTLTSGSDIFLSSDAEVSTNTTPNAALLTEGDAGNIFVNAVGTLSMISSLLTSSTTSDGEAGTITINTGDSVYLLDSTILVDSTGATTAGVGGGNLDVTTGILVLDSSILDASAGSGTGGNVSITADFFFISPDSIIDVSSSGGASGSISVNAVAVDLSGSLNALKVKFKDGGKLLRQACSTKGAASNSSSFIVENGIDGIPSSPVDFQSASTLDVIVAPSIGAEGLETSSSTPTVVSPSGAALFASIACGGF